MNISRKLYHLRIEHGLTQTDMGEIAGVSDKTISAWESGARCPKVVPYIQNICNHFQLDMLTFIDEETNDLGETTQPTETDELGDCNVIRIAGRDGSYQVRKLTDDQIALFQAMLDQLPDVPDDL